MAVLICQLVLPSAARATPSVVTGWGLIVVVTTDAAG
jgi:hypothetical protein